MTEPLTGMVRASNIDLSQKPELLRQVIKNMVSSVIDSRSKKGWSVIGTYKFSTSEIESDEEKLPGEYGHIIYQLHLTFIPQKEEEN